MKLFVVTDNGWDLGCGSQIYLIGVFDNLQDAERANGEITEVELNETYPLVDNVDWFGKENDKYLGGYVG